MSMQAVPQSFPVSTRQVAAVAALTIYLLAANPLAAAGEPTVAPGQPTPAEVPMEGGLTRDSLSDQSNEESIPPTDPPVARVDATHHAKRLARRRRRNHLPTTLRQTEVVSVQQSRRNPLESFVYVWNGWVIRTFHTKNGTVLFGRIGAKA